MDPLDLAPRELRIQMSLLDRVFYENRQLSVLACKALINDSMRHPNGCRSGRKPGQRTARPGRIESNHGGRKLIA